MFTFSQSDLSSKKCNSPKIIHIFFTLLQFPNRTLLGLTEFPPISFNVTLQLTESFASGKGGKEPVTT
jgi:hypothetical protein